MTIKINDNKLFFPKPAVNGFAGDAAYQRADNLAKEIGGVVVSGDDDIRGARPSFWVYKDYADVPAKQYSRIEEDYSVDKSYADYGFTKITLPKIGEVLARAVGADRFWREHLCNSPFRAEIIRSSIEGYNAPGHDFEIVYEKSQLCDGYELNWFEIPEAEREKLIEATNNGVKDEYFSNHGLKRVESLDTVTVK
jgi:hypothetical protein